MSSSERDKPTLQSPPRNAHLATEDVTPDSFALRESPRYDEHTELGRGGMGVVRACRDLHLGRSVAMKLLDGQSTPDGQGLASFMREAKIQAQLEHPAIVPVYDMGLVDGVPYLTMKRIRGTTLAEAIERGTFTQRKLLSALGTVCLAVDYAHTRGVIHRDLKPANVMLGDFGEVYVLDWGIAKIMGEDVDTRVDIPPALANATRAGTLSGTPRYMAPEQERGDIDAIDARTDVFALGVLLGEILARFDPSEELQAIAGKAASLRPADRFPSARGLYDALERHLSGEEERERRRELSRSLSESAASVARLAVTSKEDALDARARAMGDVGRALALDPDNVRALETIVVLLENPPREIPPEVRSKLARSVDDAIVRFTPFSTAAYASFFLLVPFVVWMGVRDWTASTLSFLGIAAAVLASLAIPRMRAEGPKRLYPLLAASTFVMTAGSTTFGPFVFVPAVAAVNTLFFVMQLGDGRVGRTIALGCVPVLVPLLLDALGLLPAAYAFTEHGMAIRPWMHAFASPATPLFLATASVGTIVLAGVLGSRYRRDLARAEERVLLQSWHLRRLLPVDLGTRAGGI